MTRPKINPKTQNKMPNSSSLWPSTPRKLTCERSGSLRLASPPASSLDWAGALKAVTRLTAPAAAPNFAIRHAEDRALLSQVRMKTAPWKENRFGQTSVTRTAERSSTLSTALTALLLRDGTLPVITGRRACLPTRKAWQDPGCSTRRFVQRVDL